MLLSCFAPPFSMSKRRRTTEPGSQIISKKKPRFVIGAPSADDERSVTDNINNSSSLSERHINDRLQSLTTLCIQVFSKNFAKLSDAEHWEHTKTELSYVSESVLPLLFKAIKSSHPSLLRHEVIATVSDSYIMAIFSIISIQVISSTFSEDRVYPLVVN